MTPTERVSNPVSLPTVSPYLSGRTGKWGKSGEDGERWRQSGTGSVFSSNVSRETTETWTTQTGVDPGEKPERKKERVFWGSPKVPGHRPEGPTECLFHNKSSFRTPQGPTLSTPVIVSTRRFSVLSLPSRSFSSLLT